MCGSQSTSEYPQLARFGLTTLPALLNPLQDADRAKAITGSDVCIRQLGARHCRVSATQSTRHLGARITGFVILAAGVRRDGGEDRQAVQHVYRRELIRPKVLL